MSINFPLVSLKNMIQLNAINVKPPFFFLIIWIACFEKIIQLLVAELGLFSEGVLYLGGGS